ncbi:hypothetical protein EST38_g560 [Candolleomyces aberdarensis]|uniref:GST C-terminal domain-containing protein n=1 Tax=Candolleomyces aberdarensis TaxID=2316362 RepID=A0A4Q2E1M5_9AGAR|nr:hypothetical protein EST38_g560 [Candolleomyces aberdarensis]
MQGQSEFFTQRSWPRWLIWLYLHFNRYASEKLPCAQKRYLDETKRLYGALEIRLTGREYLAGTGKGKYSLADIKTFPWVKTHQHACIETLDEWPNLKAGLERAVAREASESGAKVGGYD